MNKWSRHLLGLKQERTAMDTTIVFANMKIGKGVDDIIEFLFHEGILES